MTFVLLDNVTRKNNEITFVDDVTRKNNEMTIFIRFY